MAKGKIGIQQLNDSLVELLNRTVGSGINVSRNTITITQDTKKVSVNVELFNRNSDALLVFRNSTFLNQGIDYIINEDNTISTVDGSDWHATVEIPVEFSYICMRSVPANEIIVNGGMLAPESVDESKLSATVLEKINNGGLTEQDVIDIVKNSVTNDKIDNILSKEEVNSMISNITPQNLNLLDSGNHFNIDNVEDALQELASKGGEVPPDLVSKLDRLQKDLDHVKSKQLEILIKLYLEGVMMDTEAGMWFDALNSAGNINTLVNMAVYDNGLMLVDPNKQGSAEWSNINIGFLADKIRYMHEVKNSSIVIKIDKKLSNTQLQINNLSYEFE